MKKEYLDYVPLVKEEKRKKKEKDTSGFVTKSAFSLMFGFDYPVVYKNTSFIETIKYPKTEGSNGKNSRF